MKFLVTGSGGMVGRAAARIASEQGHQVVARERSQLDISDEAAVFALVDRERPDSILNCAAFTNVDNAETQREASIAANITGPGVLGRAARRVGASLVHISTDYVFDGTKGDFYTQDDPPNPQGLYAKDKLAGEREAQAALDRAIIVRSGWIFGPGGKNFLSRVIELARAGKKMQAIVDAYGTPTYGPDLAARLIELAKLDKPGIYHVTNSGGGTTFAEFSHEALRLAGLPGELLEDVYFYSLKRAAPRPRDSRIRCLISEQRGLKPLRHWREALKEFVAIS